MSRRPGELIRKGRAGTFEASEVPGDERGAAIDAYREVVSRVVSSYFAKLPSAGDHPVFRLG